MKKYMKLVCVTSLLILLTSCVSYTNGKFSQVNAFGQGNGGKVYLEEVTMSAEAATWVSLDKMRKEGKIMNASESDYMRAQASQEDCQIIAQYIARRHPELFSSVKEGALPIRLEIDGHRQEHDFSMLMAMISGLTLQIIPSGTYCRQSFTLITETLETMPKKASLDCSLEVKNKTAGIYSPFAWVGMSGATATSFGMTGGASNMWQNYYLTPEFADNVAAAVSNLLEQKNK